MLLQVVWFCSLSSDQIVEMESEPLEDLPEFEEMEEVAEPRGPHADFYDHE